MAGTNVLVIVVPTTCTVAVRVIVPAVAITVINRLARFDPIARLAVTLPALPVTVPTFVKTAPESALIVTGTPATVFRFESIAVTVIPTVALPVFGIWAELNVSIKSALVIVTWNPCDAVSVVPLTVVDTTILSAPLVVAAAGDKVTTAFPPVSVSADAGLSLPNEPEELNETTWPTTAPPFASLIDAVTVVGVVVVMFVVESVSASDGVPIGPVLGSTVNPLAPVTVAVPTVTLATTWSAPLVVAEAGANCTAALPLASVNAVVGLSVPRFPGVVNDTTLPAIGVPLASRTVAVAVTGAVTVTVVELSTNVTVGALGVVPVPPLPDPLPNADVPALPPPPPHAAKANALHTTPNHFSIFVI